MKKRLLLLLSGVLLASCGAKGPDAEEYFDAYEDAAEKMQTTKAISISSSNTYLKASFEDNEGDALEISTTPLAFHLACDDISASHIDSASIAFTMPASNNNLNKLSLSGAYLKKLTKVFAGGAIACDINAYASGGSAYIDFKSSSMVRTILSEALQNQGYPKISSNTNKLVFDEENKKKVDEYLPLTQYFDDATSSRLELFHDLYKSAPDGFTFSSGEGKSKTIAFSSKDKEKTKSIVKDLIKDDDVQKKIDTYFTYCTDIALDYSANFDDKGLTSSSFSFTLGGFDKEAIAKGNPDIKLFPTGQWKVGSKIDFAYPSETITFPDFSGYREYVFEKTSSVA